MKNINAIASIGKTIDRIIQITAIVALAAFAIGCEDEPPAPIDGSGNEGGNVNGGDGGGNSNIVAIPETPAEFAAIAGDGAITLSWNASIGATTYEIYRGVNDEDPGENSFAAVSAGSNATFEYVDMGLTNGNVYRYAITATDSAGTSSARSAVIEATAGDFIQVGVDSDPSTEGDQEIAPIPERAGGDAIIIANLRGSDAGGVIPSKDIVFITNPTEANPFIIEGNQLILPAGAAIDYETNPNFTISIQAIRSGGTGGTTGAIDIAIPIGNVDDEAPVFGAIPDVIVIEDRMEEFTTGSLTIQAIDDLGGEIAYAFLNDDGAATGAAMGFAIDSATGAISITTPPIYSETNSAANRIALAIQALDTSPGAVGETAARVDIVIAVTPLGEIILQSTAGEAFAIDESDDAPITATAIVFADSARTPADTNPYTILDGSPGFSISADGVITATIDYEALSQDQRDTGLSIVVQGEDSLGAVGIIILAITAQNIDDEAPIFDSPPTSATIVSGTRSFQGGALAISATDDLGGEIAYAFVNGDGQAASTAMGFAIDSATGAIGAATAPTFSHVDTAANRIALTIRATDTSPGATGDLASDANIVIEIIPIVDADGDGLIDIDTLEALNNIRHNLEGTSYKISMNDLGSTEGCPATGCDGYELTRSLDFEETASYAAGDINSDWRPDNADPDLATNAGWDSIGSCKNHLCKEADDEPFAAIFEGNGYTIANLYTRSSGEAGLFGFTVAGAEIRNVGLIDNNSYGGSQSGGYIGGLVGWNSGEIIASYATGNAGRGDEIPGIAGALVGGNAGEIIASYATGYVSGSDAGGLVGINNGKIIASYATGNANGDSINGSNAGGLVGLNNGEIIASYATGNANGDAAYSSNVGGLVGWNHGGEIIASYATGDANGGAGDDRVGALAGWSFVDLMFTGAITASYATGDANGGAGDDRVGALVGRNSFNGISTDPITASYGFGDVFGVETPGVDRDAAANQSIHSPAVLTAANSSTTAARQWGAAVWDFGDDRLYPVVKWATGYNSDTGAFSCDPSRIPDGQRCGDPIPGQHDSDDDGTQDMVPEAPAMQTVAATISTVTITWTAIADPEITAYRLYRNVAEGDSALGNRPIATFAADEPLTYTDIDPFGGANHYAVSAISGVGEGARSPSASAMRVPIDADGDGLIDIDTLEALNNIRHNLEGTSYKISMNDLGSTEGCPAAGCDGYELTRSLDFADTASYAAGGINSDWRPDNADPDLATNAGWDSIGSCNEDTGDIGVTRCGDADDTPFAAIFEGNGYTIANLYTRSSEEAGLFGFTVAGAEIRNVGLIDNNSYGGSQSGGYIGGLVGWNSGEIIASYATGNAGRGDEIPEIAGALVGVNAGEIIASYATGYVSGSDAGGLVGWNSGEIIASYATGNANSDDASDSDAGGLVGWNSGEIIASYATGNANGDAAYSSNVGGLVGWNHGGEIIASYATGDANGVAGDDNVGALASRNFFVGGLVGWNYDATITASYATGDANGGAGVDRVGALVGRNFFDGISTDPITASYGFGDVFGVETPGVDRDAAANQSIHSPAVLTAANSSTTAARQWGAAVWDFGDDRLYPVVKWVTGYNSDTGAFSCDPSRIPDGQRCGDPIPGQHDSDDDGTQDMVPEAPAMQTVAATVSTVTITWTAIADPEITAYRLYRNAAEGDSALGNRPIATVAASEPLTYTDSAPLDGANYYAVSAVNVAGEGARSPSASAMRSADSDGDGLIGIGTMEELNNIRHNLEGTSYKTSVSDTGDTSGCPATGCDGYELMRDLDFADAASYAAGAVDTDLLPNAADPDLATNAGWEPIGFCNNDTGDFDSNRCGDADDNPFAAIFEGNGYTITNLYTRGFSDAGLFGFIGSDAEIRNVGLIDNNSYGSNREDNVGGLVGANNGDIIASYATGDAAGGGGNLDKVGGLVGANEGDITESYATGDVSGGSGASETIGGLVGVNCGNTTASYATGEVDSGGGSADRAGGLVGNNCGNILASYATGDAGNAIEVGGLVGENNGDIIASYATGNAFGGTGNLDKIGGLVGTNNGDIIASYATGDAAGVDDVGGLVGKNNDIGTIIASYATGGADGNGFSDRVGGLVGQNLGDIIASYATGDADGGDKNSDEVGGLVGWNNSGDIIASYATGDADGGTGRSDRVGRRFGRMNGGAIFASYGFGAVMGAEIVNGSDAHLGGITAATALTATNAGAQWNAAANDTLNAWDFGSATQTPALRFADYDGAGTDYDCDMFPATLPGGATITCGTTLIPGQGR